MNPTSTTRDDVFPTTDSAWLQQAVSAEGSAAQTLTEWLEELRRQTRADAVVAIAQQGRHWIAPLHAGPLPTLPESLIAKLVDQAKPRSEAPFLGLPVHAPPAPDADPSAGPVPLVGLLVQAPRVNAKAAQAAAAETAWHLATTGHLLRQRDHFRHDALRLQRLLEYSAAWHQEDDPERLLEAIAAAATELLGAERASIFLWDRRRKKLVGKPALGVEGADLEVDDSAGIVGTVLASGQPRRWQAREDEESEVNRTVDDQLKFVTRSLVAVPLEDPAGKPIGVFEVINKIEGSFLPDDVKTLRRLALQAAAVIHSNQLRHTAIKSRDRLVEDAAGEAAIVGRCTPIKALRETVSRVAQTDLALLILGENGTGKEVLARSVHFQSPRKSEPFVAVNCAALVESLLESELFGHEKGAFTDAQQTRAGKFELATGGTLFLDEIGDMSLGGQAKLLRVLEEKVIVRVGGSTPIPVDVRVVAATNQPLVEMVREKRFREDLYFRLNVVTLQLPPLRDRGEDVLLLAEHFLADFARQIGRRPPSLDAAATAALQQHRWPGNIRELRNLMERISYLCPQPTIGAADLAFGADPAQAAAGMTATQDLAAAYDRVARDALEEGLSEATRQFQITAIDQALAANGGNVTEAAKQLGVHRSNLYRKMRQLGMPDAT